MSIPNRAGVPRGSDSSSDIYKMCTADIPIFKNTLIATYVDDTAIISSYFELTTAYQNLHIHLNNISEQSSK
jgi:hypothetical protein